MSIAIIPRKILSIFFYIYLSVYLQAAIINDADFKKQYPFLNEINKDQSEGIIELSNLQLLKPKPKGGCTGGVYQDSHHIYYVKQSNPFTELIGSKLLNLIIGTQCTPIVKLVIDEVNFVASQELDNFKTQKFYNEEYIRPCLNASGAVDLAIAMDFIGLVDRHSQNIGFVLGLHNSPLAARIDCDTSFTFDNVEPTHNTQYNPNSNHLSVSLLYYSIKKYPKDKIINSIKKITNISDEQIITTVLEAYTALSQKEPTDLEPFLVLANKLIERKKLFRESIESKNSPIYKALQKQCLRNIYKTFNKCFFELFPIHFSKLYKQFKITIHDFVFPNSNLVPMATINPLTFLQ